MICYLSGKISGLTVEEYIRNFDFAKYHIEADYEPEEIINPIDIKPFLGIKRWLFYMIADLWQLSKCTHIAMQKNWVDSKGAWLEYGYAKFILKIPVIFL